jgi:hypothetical protein
MCTAYFIIYLMFRPEYVVHDQINWWALSKNENAIDVLETHLECVDWNGLVYNTHLDAVHFLEKNIEQLNEYDWLQFSANPNATPLLEKNITKVSWYYLLQNPTAIELIRRNLHNLHWMDLTTVTLNPNFKELWLEPKIQQVLSLAPAWSGLSSNKHMVDVLEQHLDKIQWAHLSMNPNAIHLLEKHPNKIHWKYLSMNPSPHVLSLLAANIEKINWHYASSNPGTIPLLEKHMDKIDWGELSKNPNAIPLLEKHMDKIDWNNIAINPNAVHLFARLNTTKMREKCKPFSEELVAYVFHPSRVSKLAAWHNMDLCEYFESI